VTRNTEPDVKLQISMSMGTTTEPTTSAAINGGYVVLAIVGMVMSVVSAYYYLRVVVAMYMRDTLGEDTWAPVSPAAALALGLAALVILGLGVYPGPVLALARRAALSLL